ncbi:MAG: acyl-CoA dehydrogenase [Anaerolineae bacterium]|jgi:alkylation response protein AidB-like acyl-CoA dehydrogenase
MDFELNEEQRLVRDMVRDFAQNEIAPRAAEVDKSEEFPADNIEQMAELGLLGLPYPEKYGGGGGDYLSYAIAVEEIARACGSTALIYAAHVSLGCGPIYAFGTEAQKEKWLPRLCSGRGLAAFGLTEPEAGSDAGATRTTAVRDGDEYLLNGSKMWITSGAIADVVNCTAKTDPGAGTRGISCFLVEKGMPGFIPGKNEPKMGLKGSVTSALSLENCRVPAENMLGQEGEGFKQMLITLDAGRISIGAMALGLAQAAFDEGVRYARERVQFGQPIAKFQAIQWKIADMATEIDAARLMVYRAAAMKDAGRRFTREAAMAKLFASEVAERAAFQAVQIHGGYGYSREYPVERIYRDQRLCAIGEGTSEIQRLVIARQVLGRL